MELMVREQSYAGAPTKLLVLSSLDCLFDRAGEYLQFA